MRLAAFIAGALLLSSGCATSPNPPGPLAARVGQAVALEGIAQNRKLGAALKGDGFEVWIDRLQEWPGDHANRRLRVSGILEERYDLPVFVRGPGEPPAGGVEVPAGTDLREASRRYVVREARWSLDR